MSPSPWQWRDRLTQAVRPQVPPPPDAKPVLLVPGVNLPHASAFCERCGASFELGHPHRCAED